MPLPQISNFYRRRPCRLSSVSDDVTLSLVLLHHPIWYRARKDVLALLRAYAAAIQALFGARQVTTQLGSRLCKPLNAALTSW